MCQFACLPSFVNCENKPNANKMLWCLCNFWGWHCMARQRKSEREWGGGGQRERERERKSVRDVRKRVSYKALLLDLFPLSPLLFATFLCFGCYCCLLLLFVCLLVRLVVGLLVVWYVVMLCIATGIPTGAHDILLQPMREMFQLLLSLHEVFNFSLVAACDCRRLCKLKRMNK